VAARVLGFWEWLIGCIEWLLVVFRVPLGIWQWLLGVVGVL